MVKQKRRIYVGADIGGNKILVVLMEDGRILNEFQEFPTRGKLGPAIVLKDVFRAVRKSLKQYGLEWRGVEGFGITVPAPCHNGVVLDQANLKNPEWCGFDMSTAALNLARSVCGVAFDGPVVLLNDAAAALKGSAKLLGKKCLEGSVFGLFVGTGIGGSLMVNGALIDAQGGGTEPGHCEIAFDVSTRFGLTGGIEVRQREHFASLGGIQRLVPNLIASGGIAEGHSILLPRRKREQESDHLNRCCKAVLSAASLAVAERRMDDVAVEIMRVQAEVLGQFIATQVMIQRPHTIVIGGGVTEKNKTSPEFRRWFLRTLLKAIRSKITLKAHQTGFRVVIPPIGDQAAAFGAALAAWEKGT